MRLDGPEGRHAATVKRLRAGEAVLLGDGRGGLAQAPWSPPPAGTRVELTITERRRSRRPARGCCWPRRWSRATAGELAVELATEAGVDGILPWRAARCVARWDDGPRGDKALARWRSTVREAAKQARRAVGAGGRASRCRPPSWRSRVRGGAGALVLHEGASDALAAASLPASR